MFMPECGYTLFGSNIAYPSNTRTGISIAMQCIFLGADMYHAHLTHTLQIQLRNSHFLLKSVLRMDE